MGSATLGKHRSAAAASLRRARVEDPLPRAQKAALSKRMGLCPERWVAV